MFRLTRKHGVCDESVEYKGETITVNLSFDRLIKIFELQQDERLEDIDKIVLAFQILVVDAEIYKKKFTALELSEIVNLIFDSLKDERIRIDDTDDQDDEPVEIVNYTEDAERIYASFLYDYQMDLIEEIGKLSWRKFVALFNNLSEKTPMMQAIIYRTCSIPTGKENAEERKRIKKMKRIYALKSHAEAEAKRQHKEMMEYLEWLKQKQH